MAVEEAEGGSNLGKLVVIQLTRLGKVAEIHEGMDCDDEEWGCLANDDRNNVPLCVTVSPASDLFELRDPIPEMLVTDDWLNSHKPEVKFICPNNS